MERECNFTTDPDQEFGQDLADPVEDVSSTGDYYDTFSQFEESVVYGSSLEGPGNDV
jgi:hypothetical protein